jgi:hypothetical protein
MKPTTSKPGIPRARPKTRAAKPEAPATKAPPRELVDWRTHALDRMRAMILDADPGVVEEIKWRKPSNPAGVPTFSHDGIVCTLERYKASVKLTFANGASLPDPKKLFNSGLEGNLRRAIDIREGETVDASAFKALLKAAVARNVAAKKR